MSDEIKELKKEVEQLKVAQLRMLEQFKLAYDWVDMHFPDGGIQDFAKYIGDVEE